MNEVNRQVAVLACGCQISWGKERERETEREWEGGPPGMGDYLQGSLIDWTFFPVFFLGAPSPTPNNSSTRVLFGQPLTNVPLREVTSLTLVRWARSGSVRMALVPTLKWVCLTSPSKSQLWVRGWQCKVKRSEGLRRTWCKKLGEDSQTVKSSKDSKYHPTQFSPLHRSGNWDPEKWSYFLVRDVELICG